MVCHVASLAKYFGQKIISEVDPSGHAPAGGNRKATKGENIGDSLSMMPLSIDCDINCLTKGSDSSQQHPGETESAQCEMRRATGHSTLTSNSRSATAR